MNVLGTIFLKKAKTDGKTEFFERCRRTYVLNKIAVYYILRIGSPILLHNGCLERNKNDCVYTKL